MRHLKLAPLLGLLAACSTNVTPVTTETTGPSVVFRQGNNNITSLSVNADTNSSQFFAFDANDAGGVKSISITFSPSVNQCTTVSGAGYSGVYTYSPSIPPESSSSTPDSMGQVPPELFTDTTLQGPYTCVIPGISQSARPYGQTIYAFGSATNYSGKTSTAQLPITFSGWP